MTLRYSPTLEDLFLRKEELPILGFDHPRFLIPIYPPLLAPNITVDPYLAQEVFVQAVQEWYDDLFTLTQTLPTVQQPRIWYEEVFLREKPNIIKKSRERQRTKILGWEDLTFCTSTGFVSGFSISRNAGGTLFLSGQDHENEAYPAPKLVKFSEEKIELYAIDPAAQHPRIYVYQTHNVDHLPGALFLRNWAILYLNAALTKLFQQ